jgi:hypothetical protein
MGRLGFNSTIISELLHCYMPHQSIVKVSIVSKTSSSRLLGLHLGSCVDIHNWAKRWSYETSANVDFLVFLVFRSLFGAMVLSTVTSRQESSGLYSPCLEKNSVVMHTLSLLKIRQTFKFSTILQAIIYLVRTYFY